jgi:hypothetical protein
MTAKGYTTETLVEGELLYSITESSNPTSSQVANFIEEVEAEIDELTETSFTEVTITDEIIPFTERNAFMYSNLAGFGGIRTDYIFPDKQAIFLTASNVKRRPITSITSLYRNLSGSTLDADSWEQLTEQTGSGGDFILDKQTGLIVFINNKPPFGHHRAIKCTFKYGYSSIPSIVKTLATKMVAKRVLIAKVMKSQMSSVDDISLESISINKGVNKSISLMKQLQFDIDTYRQKVVGDFKVDIV